MSVSGFSFYHGQIEFWLFWDLVSYGQESIQEKYCTLYPVFYVNKPYKYYFNYHNIDYNLLPYYRYRLYHESTCFEPIPQ